MGMKQNDPAENPYTMCHLLRSLTFGLLAGAGLSAAAQGHTLFVAGHLTPCDPANAGNTVNIHVYGIHSGPVAIATPLNENCYYYVELQVPDTAGLVFVGTSCSNGTFVQDSVAYSLTPPFSTDAIVDLSCGNSSTSCDACYTFTQTVPFTGLFSSCSSGGTGVYTYVWDFSGPGGGAVTGDGVTHSFQEPGHYVACLNITDSEGCTSSICHQVYVDDLGNVSFDQPEDCHACFQFVQSQSGGSLTPFSVDLVSCSEGYAPLYVEWALPNGSWAGGNTYTYPVNGAGLYSFCAHLSTGNGCTSTVCDTVYINASGWIDPSPSFDCNGALFGPDTVGMPCQVNGVPGIWDWQCQCVPSTPLECEAGYWVIQAYDSINGQIEPILNELWIWNLSQGGTTPYTFQWTFGDGTSSNEAFPTHVYPTGGPYELCLTLTDAAGCTDTYCDTLTMGEDGIWSGMIVRPDEAHGNASRSGFTIRVRPEAGTGVQELTSIEHLTIAPNPVQDLLRIALDSRLAGSADLVVMDTDGRVVATDRRAIGKGANRIELPAGHLPAGLYLVRITSHGQTLTQRFIRTH